MNEEVFKQAAPMYNDALSASGFNERIQYTEEQPQVKRRRTRNIIWLNPPFSRNIPTNVARGLLKLINRHFKKASLSKISHRNNVKVSYSCMPSVASRISRHKKQQLEKEETCQKKCNCRVKVQCPLDGFCQTSGIGYKATVSTE